MPAASTSPQRGIDRIRAAVVRPRGVRNDDADRRPWARKRPFQTRPAERVVHPVCPCRATSGCPSHLFHLSQKPWNFASPPDTLSGMHKIIEIFADRAALHTEILALRQQVAVLKRKRPRPLLRKADRVFWVILSCLWPGWRHALVIVRPETVIGWHRKAFRLFWTWKSRRGKPGRPPVSREIRYLVRRMSRENTRWGAPRIHGELLKLGFSISQAAVSKYMVRYPSPPSQSWRTFLTNHADCLASIDFFVVPTATVPPIYSIHRRNLGILHHHRIPFPACIRSSNLRGPRGAPHRNPCPATAGSCPETEKAPAIASEGG